jgi:hypothetical protein
MAEASGCYGVKADDVAAKVIDGELIIIRLSDGTYYSMDNVGAHVWELLEGQTDLRTIAETIADRYRAPVEQVARDLERLVQDLLDEALIVPVDGERGTPAERPAAGPALAYQAPRLNVYRDMGNLLALDPPTPGIDDLLFDTGKRD